MAKNCLVRKLMGVSDNDNLIKITDFIFGLGVMTTINEYTKLQMTFTGSAKVTGDAYFTNLNGDNLGKEINNAGTDMTFYIYSPSSGNKLIFNNASITTLRTNYFPFLVDSDFGMLSPNLSYIDCASPNFNIDIEQLSENPALIYLSVLGLCGDIEKLVNVPLLQGIETSERGDGLYGDAAKVADNILKVDTKATLGYTSRDTSKTMVLISGGANLGNRLDDYLINSAACQDNSYPYKNIKIVGTKTSASDAAVATLKGRGCTVNVNGEVL